MKLKVILENSLSTLDKELSERRIYIDFWSYFSNPPVDMVVEAVGEGRMVINVKISKEDQITVLSKTIMYGNPNLTFVPLVVMIGIGRCEISDGIYKVSKCSAELLYNECLELVDVDFYLRDINILKDFVG